MNAARGIEMGPVKAVREIEVGPVKAAPGIEMGPVKAARGTEVGPVKAACGIEVGPVKAARGIEKIHETKHEGRMKMDKALVSAESLLQGGDEDLRNQTNAKLRELKTLWEETCTYVTHCHSRIEWVWLHWSEYLKAYKEFELWLARQQCLLDVAVELQLGVKEKLWQVDQQRVVVSDVHGHAALLERLLDEAAALHNRTQDASIDPQVQETMQEAYGDVRTGLSCKDERAAVERLSVLQKIAGSPRCTKDGVQRFRLAASKTRELTDLMETEDTADNKLRALRVLDDSVASEEKTLQHIEGVSEAVRANTCPAGAEVVVEEAEELRLGWQRLRQGLYEAGEGLRSSLDSHSQYLTRCQQLGEDISRLRLLLQGLDKELEEGMETGDQDEHTEDQLVGQWRKYSGVRNTLEEEESQVEHLKAQLKELFRFSQDSRHLSHDVLAVVKEHQSVKSRATQLCSESESGLENVLQDPLLVFAQWSHRVSQALQGSSEVNDFSHIAMLVQSIETLLTDSIQLKEAFSLLQEKRDLLVSVFGSERGDGLQGELSAAIRTRELLHAQLLQRKTRLQGLISRTKDFSEASDLIRSKLAGLRDLLNAADSLQPDILAKKSQLDQLRIIQKDLEDCQGHITALETLASSSPSSRTQSDKLQVECKNLHKAVRVRPENTQKECFQSGALVTTICSRCSSASEPELTNAQHHTSVYHNSDSKVHSNIPYMALCPLSLTAEGFFLCESHSDVLISDTCPQRALGEFPEKELQLQQMEVQGQGVLERTSEEGRIHILGDMKHLRESWTAVYNMSLNIHRLLNASAGLWRVRGLSAENAPSTELSLEKMDILHSTGGSRSQNNQPKDKFEHHGVHARSGSAGEGSMEFLRLGRWIPGHLQQGHQPPGPVKDSGYGAAGEVEDSSSWTVLGRSGQTGQSSAGVSRTSAAEPGSPKSSVLTGLHGRTAATTTVTGSQPSSLSCGDGSVETEESLSPGGGAFTMFREDSAKQRLTPTARPTGSTTQFWDRRTEFEAWLCQQIKLLSGILSAKGTKLRDKDLKVQQDLLTGLRAELSWGQEQFQLLLQESQTSDAGPGVVEDADLEELRYRWMLYKSKLKDVGNLRTRLGAKTVPRSGEIPPCHARDQTRLRCPIGAGCIPGCGNCQPGGKEMTLTEERELEMRAQSRTVEPSKAARVEKKPGLLQRACHLALPLWLLLLALLLLAFLLPLVDERNTCSLSNNFARSFNIMLRYNGPPPT
ncbi:LOW QUALITY PROTEIN: nesprin-3 [Thalassophryne amazonica]|uniref:LOW QUALITY PROTEIN: nesprin-3 n=1 Tax=Thalassophryne amazonica TaxID=390379 RepID=UPI001470D030|nr:LOW QUALITY PROTEIN: nesprin-3 [Thalassophryne amazonica]